MLVVNFGSPSVVQAAPSGCSTIYSGSNGWVIDLCTTEPEVPTPMTVFLNGVPKGNARLIRVYHKSENDPGTPQVAVIYASGYIRLKQNDDPSPSIPFGASFILGPAYWTSTNHHHPQLTRLDLDTTWLPDSPLRMKAVGTNDAFNVTYDMALPPPRDRQTRLHVDQTYTATANIAVPAARLTNKEGFKLVQVSTMYIKNTLPCTGGYTECHDSNDIRFIAGDQNRRQLDFSGLTPPSFIMSAPRALGAPWLDVLHKDDLSWQSQTGAGTSGNTPNLRIALDELPTSYTITPQGWIDLTTDPNQDNVTVWLHDDRASSGSWTPGRTDRVSYWLLAQDNPPDPLTDLGLRPGVTFLDFNGAHNCYLVKDTDTTGAVSPGNGYTDRVMRLTYNLGNSNGNWAQIRCDFNPPLNLSAYDHLRFEWQGSRNGGNTLEVGLVNPNGRIFGRGYHHITQHFWWGQLIVPFRFLQPWVPNTQFNPSQVSAIFISVVKDPVADVGGAGTMAIDNLGAFNSAARVVPGSFETVAAPVAAQAAANWLAAQQRPSGLLRSWDQDPVCWSYTYDQALALIVFSKQGMWTQADALVDRLAALQNPDGSWYQRHDCLNLVVPGENRKWEGDIAWAVYALRRYLDLGGTHQQARTALLKGANWLATLVNPADGCLVPSHEHTEATIDMWWAFQAAGNNHANNAERIKNCLLTQYWDNSMGRIKGGRNWWKPYLDNQTWGAAFLKAIDEPEKARRALSYARDVLRLPAQGGQLFGFDGESGPWSVWNEGTAQYISVGGNGARDLLRELLAQQRPNGAMPGSPDNFSGDGVWTTRWHGVAPTAWLYNALSGEPFHVSPSNTEVYVGTAKQGAFFVPPNARVSFPVVNGGPVKIINTDGTAMFAAERIVYRSGGVQTSYCEMMALPDSLLDTTYWLPWYNNVDLDTQLRIANVSGSAATVQVYIGGQQMPGSPFTLAAGESTRKSYAVSSGPVKIVSTQNVVVAERVIYKVNNANTSFTEIMALPNGQLSRTYWLPWYNNVDLDTQLRIANVSSSPATVMVTIGGVEMPSFSLAAGESTRKSYAVNNGPVKIASTQNVVVAERVVYKVNGINTSFSEMMALPNEHLDTTHWLPWYNNVDLDTQLRIANVSNSTATVHVYIGGVEMQGSPFSLAAGESTRKSYPVSNGPVRVVSAQNVVVAERMIYKINNVNTSFTELMALPNALLDPVYWLPWYNNVDLDTQLRFGVP